MHAEVIQPTPSFGRWLRWILVPCALALVFLLGSSISIVVLPWGTARSRGEILGAFGMQALLVLVATFTAPSHRLLIAIAIAAAGASLANFIPVLSESPLGVWLGGFAAVCLVAAWSFARKKPITAFASLAMCAAASLLCLRIADDRLSSAEATPSPIPSYLAEALGPRASEISPIYIFDRGFMMNSWQASRFDATPEVVELIVRGMKLTPTESVPATFWRLPPKKWPREPSANDEAYWRESEQDESLSGSDHEWCLLVYDKALERAYLWYEASL